MEGDRKFRIGLGLGSLLVFVLGEYGALAQYCCINYCTLSLVVNFTANLTLTKIRPAHREVGNYVPSKTGMSAILLTLSTI